MTADALLCRLDGLQGRAPKWRAICPAHQSQHGTRSLAIGEADDGRLLVHCFAGCDAQAIVAAVGLELADLFPTKLIGHGAADQFRPRIRQPWSVRDVIAALRGELMVAYVLLGAVAAGTPPNDDDRERAGIAMERIAHFLAELDHAA
ncbi:MAG: DNA primase [Anaerolineae bacterium]|jgi:hypothetical protein|nr:DNA primase [Anaerolineae bacterium]